MKRETITAVIIARNEEERIVQCLESVKWCDEIVVIDDMSTDDTHSVCRRFRVEVVARPLNEDYAAQRNAGIAASNSDWILQLDADERVTPELRVEIKKILNSNNTFSAYSILRKNYFLGRFMKYGGWHERQTKLFKKTKGRYVRPIHEQLEVDGRIGRLNSSVEHYPFSSISEFIRRQLYYANIEAKVIFHDKGKVSLEEIRYHMAVKPIKLFLKLFIKKQGFRDGMHGFIFSILNAWRHFAIWSVYWDKYQMKGEKV